MTPILFEAKTTAYNTNGIGRLTDALACTVEENLNGLYELTMTYPITGQHYSDIAIERLIVAEPFNGGTWQPFRIYKISRPLNGVVTVHAEHISYLLNKVVVMPFTAASCAEAIANIKTYAANNCPFTFDTDKSALGEMTVDTPRAARGLLGGEQGSLLDVYGKGEYEFDRFNVYLHVNRGTDKGITIRYGKNLTELVRDSDITNTYTGIVPFYAQDGETLTLPEEIIWSDYRNQFAYDIVKPVDFSQKWQERPTVEQLRAAAQTYVQNNEGWKVADNVTLSFVALWQTEEYKSIANVERVNMGDIVHVIYEALGVETSAEVIRTVYDSLMERYTEIELGTKKNSLATAIQEALDTVSATEATSMISQAVDHATDLITGANGGHVVLGTNADGQPNEIFIMDTADVGTANQVLRINMNGIGFSSNGVDGPYGTAWTLDGHFVANYIYTGKLSARNNNFVLDLDAGTLTMGNKALIITAGNLQLDANGNVNVTGAITATSLTLGNGVTVPYSKVSGTPDLTVYVAKDGTIGSTPSANTTGFKVSSAGLLTASNAVIYGTIYSSAGTIGGWNITGSSIQTNGASYGNSGMYFGTSGISLGNTFKVTSGGVLSCSGASISGTLTAKGNSDGDVVIGGGRIRVPWIEFYTQSGNFAASWTTDNSTSNGNSGYHRLWCGYGIRLSGESSTWNWIENPSIIDANTYFKAGVFDENNGLQFTSDRRKKQDITYLDADDAAKRVMNLKPARFKFTATPNVIHHGFIAQDVQEIIDDGWNVVEEYTDLETQETRLSLRYTEIIADLVATVQSQNRRITALERKTS